MSASACSVAAFSLRRFLFCDASSCSRSSPLAISSRRIPRSRSCCSIFSAISFPATPRIVCLRLSQTRSISGASCGGAEET
ncbi:hypothetical protein IP79_10175 [Porphyrobacter sp. AAP60]|nr:hypothetical protein IP79_10175 [Porphyrobacter sp. AAP60]